MEIKTINIICRRDLNIARLDYTIDFINNHPLKPLEIEIRLNSPVSADIEVNYGNSAENGFYMPAQFLFFDKSQVDSSTIFASPYLLQGNTVYSVEASANRGDDLVKGKSFAFDIFEAMFFHISRYEEVFASDAQLDEHFRMKTGEHFLVKNGIHHFPVVDHLVIAFFRALGFNAIDKPSRFSLTHDIDAIQKFNSTIKLPKSIGRVLLMGLGLKGVINIIKWYLKTLLNRENDPYYVFDKLLTSSNNFDNKLIFFVAGGNTRFDIFNKNYIKCFPRINSLASQKSYNIGFHPSYLAYNDATLFRDELARLRSISGKQVTGFRTHFLRMDFQKTFDIAQENGLTYDSSLGYNDDFGFRCGTGFEYNLYDFANEKAYNIKEIPLVIMDSSALFFYCNENTDCFRKKLMDFIDKNRNNTHICINFHNSTFDKSLKSRSDINAIYCEMLSLITK
jgi:hypothetical protein